MSWDSKREEKKHGGTLTKNNALDYLEMSVTVLWKQNEHLGHGSGFALPPMALFTDLTFVPYKERTSNWYLKIIRSLYGIMIPGKDNGRLIKYLIRIFDIFWAKTAKIEKNGAVRSSESTMKTLLLLKLNDTNSEVSIEVDGSRPKKLIAKNDQEQK